jgi:hypothetical protein
MATQKKKVTCKATPEVTPKTNKTDLSMKRARRTQGAKKAQGG